MGRVSTRSGETVRTSAPRSSLEDGLVEREGCVADAMFILQFELVTDYQRDWPPGERTALRPGAESNFEISPRHALLPAHSRIGCGTGNAQEYHDRALQAQHIPGGKTAHKRPDPGFRDGGDLIHHQPAGSAQSIAVARLNGEAKKGSIGGIRREGADRDGVCPVEAVVLENHNRPGLSRVVFAAGDGPNLAAPQDSPQSEMASIKS